MNNMQVETSSAGRRRGEGWGACMCVPAFPRRAGALSSTEEWGEADFKACGSPLLSLKPPCAQPKGLGSLGLPPSYIRVNASVTPACPWLSRSSSQRKHSWGRCHSRGTCTGSPHWVCFGTSSKDRREQSSVRAALLPCALQTFHRFSPSLSLCAFLKIDAKVNHVKSALPQVPAQSSCTSVLIPPALQVGFAGCRMLHVARRRPWRVPNLAVTCCGWRRYNKEIKNLSLQSAALPKENCIKNK